MVLKHCSWNRSFTADTLYQEGVELVGNNLVRPGERSVAWQGKTINRTKLAVLQGLIDALSAESMIAIRINRINQWRAADRTIKVLIYGVDVGETSKINRVRQVWLGKWLAWWSAINA